MTFWQQEFPSRWELFPTSGAEEAEHLAGFSQQGPSVPPSHSSSCFALLHMLLFSTHHWLQTCFSPDSFHLIHLLLLPDSLLIQQTWTKHLSLQNTASLSPCHMPITHFPPQTNLPSWFSIHSVCRGRTYISYHEIFQTCQKPVDSSRTKHLCTYCLP